MEEEKSFCCVCLENDYLYTNCNHELCNICYLKLTPKNCPICRKKILNYL